MGGFTKNWENRSLYTPKNFLNRGSIKKAQHPKPALTLKNSNVERVSNHLTSQTGSKLKVEASSTLLGKGISARGSSTHALLSEGLSLVLI
jgi:hypothetical protein